MDVPRSDVLCGGTIWARGGVISVARGSRGRSSVAVAAAGRERGAQRGWPDAADLCSEFDGGAAESHDCADGWRAIGRRCDGVRIEKQAGTAQHGSYEFGERSGSGIGGDARGGGGWAPSQVHVRAVQPDAVGDPAGRPIGTYASALWGGPSFSAV